MTSDCIFLIGRQSAPGVIPIFCTVQGSILKTRSLAKRLAGGTIKHHVAISPAQHARLSPISRILDSNLFLRISLRFALPEHFERFSCQRPICLWTRWLRSFKENILVQETCSDFIVARSLPPASRRGAFEHFSRRQALRGSFSRLTTVSRHQAPCDDFIHQDFLKQRWQTHPLLHLRT